MNYDNAIKDLFRQLRREDERRAPSFDPLVSGIRKRKAAVRRLPIVARLAGVLAGVALTSFTLVSVRLSGADQEFARTVEAGKPVAQWRAPTDVLLKSPNNRLMRGVPKLGETFADMNIKFE